MSDISDTTPVTNKEPVMTACQQIVQVHRRGTPGTPKFTTKPRVATADTDGRLYVRHSGRWWMLSNESPDGWRSINVAPCDPALDARLDARSSDQPAA
jgi:hypothetical protein